MRTSGGWSVQIEGFDGGGERGRARLSSSIFKLPYVDDASTARERERGREFALPKRSRSVGRAFRLSTRHREAGRRDRDHRAVPPHSDATRRAVVLDPGLDAVAFERYPGGGADLPHVVLRRLRRVVRAADVGVALLVLPLAVVVRVARVVRVAPVQGVGEGRPAERSPGGDAVPQVERGDRRGPLLGGKFRGRTGQGGLRRGRLGLPLLRRRRALAGCLAVHFARPERRRDALSRTHARRLAGHARGRNAVDVREAHAPLRAVVPVGPVRGVLARALAALGLARARPGRDVEPAHDLRSAEGRVSGRDGVPVSLRGGDGGRGRRGRDGGRG
eukprot:CAMPEP_0172566970 /NCGR_PEP_ID=MMETSP1067-20121228/113983_1 /TAXON_ID=265564 ORGANISM="Thalassiosira punctigera, Strain Tpunct2005C2" /NCGR_SAMPLE_ID=MMETSP1067 /ASSEMBLY_ACC=CAM_ASM_000444 /LENGTH=331 /DNA_ID=CAMNT_0013358213 /DNA_START=65 /DNA_END=1057 /DNA_ORIENTATION=+